MTLAPDAEEQGSSSAGIWEGDTEAPRRTTTRPLSLGEGDSHVAAMAGSLGTLDPLIARDR